MNNRKPTITHLCIFLLSLYKKIFFSTSSEINLIMVIPPNIQQYNFCQYEYSLNGKWWEDKFMGPQPTAILHESLNEIFFYMSAYYIYLSVGSNFQFT